MKHRCLIAGLLAVCVSAGCTQTNVQKAKQSDIVTAEA